MNKHRINSLLLRTGPFLDFTYWLAYYAFSIRDLLRERIANFFPVRLHELQQLPPSLTTRFLEFHVTSACDAKCKFCAYPKVLNNGLFKPKVLDLDLFKNTVMELVSHGGRNLCLTPLVGEALVDPWLFERIEFAIRKAKIPTVHLCSNGIRLDKNDNYKRLVDSGITELNISTQGTDPKAFLQVYGVNKYAEFLSGLSHLLEYNRERGEPVKIGIRFRSIQRPSQIVASDDYQKYIQPYLSKRVRVSFTVRYSSWGGTLTQADLPPGMRLARKRKHVNLPCVNLYACAILPSGHVRMCGCVMKHSDIDDLVIGNLQNQSLYESVTGPKPLSVIAGFYTGNWPEVCRHCELYVPITRRWLKRHQAIAFENTQCALVENPSG